MSDKTNKKNIESVVKVWLGDDGIVYTYLAGRLGEEEIKKFIEEKTKVLKTVKEKTGSFADLRDIIVGVDFSLAGKAKRLIVAEIKELEQQKVKKMAILGNKISLKFISIVLGMALGIEDTKYFTEKEKALKWLKEK